MEISGLDFCLINILSYIAGLSTGLLVCCKHKDKFFGRSENQERGLDEFQAQPYSPPPQAEVVASSTPVEQVNKGVRITLE
tara:strand:- start:2654 stop:2896 length:243 start_codon:yes stop_codon:yes gene_type:complete